MSFFARQTKIRGLATEKPPVDPNDPLVDHIYASYPYGSEPFTMRAIIRTVVFTIMAMKERGML